MIRPTPAPRLQPELYMVAILALLLAMPQAAQAQGLVKGVQQGAEAGNKAAGPVGGVLGGAIGGVVGGSVLIEQIFQYQGVGYYLFDSLSKRDYTLTQGFILIITISVIAANLVADLLLSRIDPRVRSQGSADGR